jgi:hypothetical protein
MRRVINAVLVGSLAFGLVAAAAAGASLGSLTVDDIVRIGTGDATANLVVEEVVCDADYAIEWDVSGSTITGFSAAITIGMVEVEFCADQPFVLQIDAVEVASGQTEADGSIAPVSFGSSIEIPDDAAPVRLIIGPEAATF